MSEEIVKLDDVKEKIRDRIKAAFFDLIPPEKWDELIKNETDFLTTDKKDRYSNKVTPSPLKAMIRDMIREEWQKSLNAYKEELRKEMELSPSFWGDKFRLFARECAREYQDMIGAKIIRDAMAAFQLEKDDTAVCVSCGRPVSRGTNCPHCGYYNA